MYKTESMLGLAGSIIAAVITALTVVGTLIAVLFIDFFGPIVFRIVERMPAVRQWFFFDGYESFIGFAAAIFIILAAIGVVIAAASFILGFIGSSKLRSDDKNGGILLIIAGVLSFVSVIGFIPFVLFIVGGVMSTSKRAAVPLPAGQDNAV